jgi:L-amino acid N-acyltransferase YncA
MPYAIREIDGREHEATIHAFNRMAPETFPELDQQRHIESGFWWLAYFESEPVAFAGLVEFLPFPNIGYFKRCYVLPDHHGHGLQLRFMQVRETKARQLGWSHLISECSAANLHSAANFRRHGFEQVEPEQRWGAPDSIYWKKDLTAYCR